MRNLLVIIFLLASLSGLAQSADGIFQTVTASGQNSYTIAAALPNASAYDSKEKFIVVFTLASTGSVTLNRNGIGAKAVRDSEGTQLGSGDILAGQRLLLSYNGTYYQVIGGTGSGSVSQTITNGVTDSSPSEDAIFDRFGNVDNTPDASKPVSTAQQTAIDAAKRTEYGVACSDLTTALTAGTTKAYFRIPRGLTVTAVRASLLTAQSSGSIFTVDINESGLTILSTKLTIDNTEKTSTTALTAYALSDSALADDAEITIDIDQIGNGTAVGLIIWIIGY